MPFDGTVLAFQAPSAVAARPNCALCPAASACLIGGLPRESVEQWNSLVQGHVSLTSAGKALFEVGDPMSAIYVVRAGCVKSVTVDADGNERVRGFHLPGDLIGLDALNTERYPSAAVAVVASQVCRIPRAVAMQKLAQSPALMQRLLERLSQNLGAALALSGDYTADQRVAAFLLNMQLRLNPVPGAPAKLPMARRDIANYLRLATETVCRVLTRFADKGLIQAEDRQIRLLKLVPLQSLAAPVGMGRSPALLARAA
jgi:CRP/FNR family transcriptional regulator